MRINLPTWLTLFRVALLPVMVVAFYLPFPGHNITAAIVFVLAAITDWLDGYLARRMKLTSAFGAFLDPVADKLTPDGRLPSDQEIRGLLAGG